MKQTKEQLPRRRIPFPPKKIPLTPKMIPLTPKKEHLIPTARVSAETEVLILATIIVTPAIIDKTYRPKPKTVIMIPVRIRTTQGQIRHQARIRKSRMMIQGAVKMIPHQAEFPPEML